MFKGLDMTEEEIEADYLKYLVANHYWGKTSADEERALELENMEVEVVTLKRDHHWNLYRVTYS